MVQWTKYIHKSRSTIIPSVITNIKTTQVSNGYTFSGHGVYPCLLNLISFILWFKLWNPGVLCLLKWYPLQWVRLIRQVIVIWGFFPRLTKRQAKWRTIWRESSSVLVVIRMLGVFLVTFMLRRHGIVMFSGARISGLGDNDDQAIHVNQGVATFAHLCETGGLNLETALVVSNEQINFVYTCLYIN